MEYKSNKNESLQKSQSINILSHSLDLLSKDYAGK